MKNFWSIVNNVIDDADILLLLLDARLVDETRNEEVESKVKRQKKPLIYVITKCDLADKESVEKYKKELYPSVFVSAKEHFGTTMLRNTILMEAKRAGIKTELRVGVLGYPNVGKSSLINAMKGRKAASTSVLSGHTKHIQKIRADNRIILIDTPGVIPYQEKDPVKHTFIGTIDFNKAREPDIMSMELMMKFPGRIEKYYGVEINEDKEETLYAIAKKKCMLKKGGLPDLERTARMILKDWQKGVITPDKAYAP